MADLPAKVGAQIVGPTEFSEDEVKEQVQKIQRVMESVMKKDTHYGTIPGCGDKPTLLKAGAEKLGFTFRLAPQFQITTKELPKGHREIEVLCILSHITTGHVVAMGVGSCTTMESKYRYRTASLSCPECGNDTGAFMKSKKDPGWFCWTKRGGCGVNLPPDAVQAQDLGRVENPDIADTYNTVLKMAKKRAHVDAILTATAASDIFTQDIEDMDLEKGKPPPKEEGREPMPSRGRGAPKQDPPKKGELTATEPQQRKLNAMLNKLEATEGQQKDFVYFCAGRSSPSEITRTEIQEMYRILDGLTEPFMLADWLQHAQETFEIDTAE